MTLKETLAAKIDQANALSKKSEGGSLTPEEVTQWGGLIEEIRGLRGQAALAEQTEEHRAWGEQPASGLPLAGKAGAPAQPGKVQLEGFTKAGDDEGLIDDAQWLAIKTPEYKRAFRSYLRKGERGLTQAEVKTLSEGVDSAGGFLVPEEMVNRIIQREPTPARVAGMVTQLSTSRDSIVLPKVNYSTDDLYTTGIRVTWTGETPASATAHRVTDPVWGQSRVPVYTAMLSMPLTNDLVEDAAFPLVSFVSGKFAETVELVKEDKIINGTGIGQPTGILVSPGGTDQPAVIVSGSAAALLADGLIDVPFAIPEQYQQNGRWLMNIKSTAKAIAKLKDGNNRYLWGLGVDDSGLSVAVMGRKLLGYDVAYSGFMPDVAASAYPIIFGDFGGYFLVNRIGFSIQVLRELYAETNQIVLLGRVRFGGATLEPWKLKIQQAHT